MEKHKNEQIEIRRIKLKDVNWLSDNEKEILNETFKHLEIENSIDKKPVSSNAVKLSQSGSEKEQFNTITVQNIQFDEKTRVEIISSSDELFGVKVFYIDKENEEKMKFISNMNGKIVADENQEIDKNTLENPDLLDTFYDMLDVENEDQNTINAWYDNIPCLGNGCCIIKEPLYPGEIPTIPVTYKWCGANCGSGDPVNDVDACCKAHDRCYGNFPSYPDRCDCDQNIIDCVSKKGTRAASLISAAFNLKKINNC